jgi:hypothetical protein
MYGTISIDPAVFTRFFLFTIIVHNFLPFSPPGPSVVAAPATWIVDDTNMGDAPFVK